MSTLTLLLGTSVTKVIDKQAERFADPAGARERFKGALVSALLPKVPPHLAAHVTPVLPPEITDVTVLFVSDTEGCAIAMDGLDANDSSKYPWLAALVEILGAVAYDPHRYGWDGAPLVTPIEAVRKLLRRIEDDPDFAHQVGPLTESLRVLCEAEARESGVPLFVVMRRYERGALHGERRYLLHAEHEELAHKRKIAKSHP